MDLTRRYFIRACGTVAAYLGVAPLPALAMSAQPAVAPTPVTRGRTLVVIFLRGGADGLNLVVPHGDPAYASLRRQTRLLAPRATDQASVVDLDGFFGLHPSMRGLKGWFERGEMVAAHAVGYDANTRSHFEEQDVWETGVIGNTVNSDGWLNRHLMTSVGHGTIRAVALGTALPRILQGRAPAYAISGVRAIAMPTVAGVQERDVRAALEHAYRVEPDAHVSPARDLLAAEASATIEGVDQLASALRAGDEPTVPYPDTALGKQMMQVAQLIKADIGLEVAQVDHGGWDTHANQGGASGHFATRAMWLAGAIDAFCRDLGDRMNDTLVLTLTDFGRTATENGTGGTDHGWANCMLLAGGPVARARAAEATQRRVVTRWPGLGPEQLHQRRDLLHTTDFRDVLAEVVRVHLGNPNLERVLPSHAFRPVGLIA